MKTLSSAHKSVYRRIKRANDKFAAMSKKEKRVQIAKDVLMQIEAKRIKPRSGIYLAANNLKGYEYGDLDENTQVRDVLKDQKCNACAVGSMFLCAVDKHDRLKVGELPGIYVNETSFAGYDLYDYLEKFFSLKQLNAIEDAFEGDYLGIKSDKKRLKAIMKNIIENDGKFIY